MTEGVSNMDKKDKKDNKDLVTLEIPARPEFLGLVRAVVAAAANVESDFRDDRVEDLRLAVSEATTNAIEAHQLIGLDNRISVQAAMSDDRIEVVVRDQGPGFDPAALEAMPEPGTPERLFFENGLGIPLMRELADESDISSSSDGTTVRLVIYTRRYL